MSARLRTIVYVDGFNLYYRCLKGTSHRWLNLVELSRAVLSPVNDVVAVKYYTARVNAYPGNPGQPVRQETYLRALRTLPEVSIYFGHYLSHPVRLPLAKPQPGQPRFAEVIRAEEKGSDVNLATHLVRDAFRGAFDVAAVITNDSDLCEPIRVVVQELGKSVGVLRPGTSNPSHHLRQVATFVRDIRPGALTRSQFPAQLRDTTGDFSKPAAW
jgi:hypothetical protein